ncbi:MAG: ADP-ribosylglycohydrolase family protein [Thermoproteota archaeon]
MGKILLGRDDYLDKMRGCWLGKNIGGTLGTPYEGKKYAHCLDYYDPVPTEPLPNDDLDFQLVWLKMLEDRGVCPTFKDFSEYSFCTYNLLRGLKPPISGAFQNYWVDEMGSPIRSEIWACVAPGDPQLAASMAWMDSSMDHAGGEGRWGEMFWAAVESAAFVIQDPKTLIEIGLSMIPVSSHVARAIREASRCHECGIEWGEARERIATTFGHHNPCNAVPNHGFTIIGWLYGKDYGDKLCKAVNCGYDTDCTGATLGSVLGIIHGASGIPEEWKRPVGEAITPVGFTVTEGLPKTIGELVARTRKVAEEFLSRRSRAAEFAGRTSAPEDALSSLFDNQQVRGLLCFDVHCSVEDLGGLQVAFHYGGEPVLRPGVRKTFEVSLMESWKPVDASAATVGVKAPAGWEVSQPLVEGGRFKFSVLAGAVDARNVLELAVKAGQRGGRAEFTVLGPEAAKPIPASTHAPKD